MEAASHTQVELSSPLLRASDAAELLSVRTSWIYEAVRTGQLPCLRIGRHIRWEHTFQTDHRPGRPAAPDAG